MNNQANTEGKILAAAKKIFIEKGFDGARMQQISEEAGINKALLHYYFRSKDKLFEAVFEQVINELGAGIIQTLTSKGAPKEKLEQFIELYFKMLTENPFLPGFMIQEIQRNPNFVQNLLHKYHLSSDGILTQVRASLFSENVHFDQIRHFVISLISLVIMPIMMKPVFQTVLFSNREESYLDFLEERKDNVIKMMFQLYNQIK